MSGLGVRPWTVAEWDAYEKALAEVGWWVDHCSHCDRSSRHPSCVVRPIIGQEQKALARHAERGDRSVSRGSE